jgi:hypothetical protein
MASRHAWFKCGSCYASEQQQHLSQDGVAAAADFTTVGNEARPFEAAAGGSQAATVAAAAVAVHKAALAAACAALPPVDELEHLCPDHIQTVYRLVGTNMENITTVR